MAITATTIAGVLGLVNTGLNVVRAHLQAARAEVSKANKETYLTMLE